MLLKKNLCLILILLAVIAITFFFWNHETMAIIKAASSGDMQTAAQIIKAGGNIAILISIVLNVIISLAGVIPSVFLTGANILVFDLYVYS